MFRFFENTSKATLLKFTIQWDWCLLFVSFWVFALFPPNFTYSMSGIIFTFFWIAYTASLCFLLLKLINNEHVKTSTSTLVEIRTSEVAYFLLFLLSYLFLASHLANDDLNSDELTYTSLANSIAFLLIKILIKCFPSFQECSSSQLLWGMNIFLVFCGCLGLQLTRKMRFKTPVTLLLFLFLVASKFPLQKMFAHPSFSLFPPWIGGLFFSVSPISSRIPSILCLCAYMVIIMRYFKEMGAPSPLPILGTILILSHPLLIHTSTLVEPSLWSFISWTFTLMELMKWSRKSPSFSWFRLFSVLSIFILMRITSLVCLIPTSLLFLYSEVYSKKRKRKDLLFDFFPAFVSFPVILTSLIFKSSGAQAFGPLKDLSSIQRVLFAVNEGIFFRVLVNSTQWIGLFFLLLGLFLWKKEHWRIQLLVVMTFCSGCFLFFSANPTLWGLPRYQAEFALPFVMFGIGTFLIRGNAFFSPWLKPSIMLALIIYQSIQVFDVHNANPPATSKEIFKKNRYYESVVISRDRFRYLDAVRKIKKINKCGKLGILGLDTRSFSAILAGCKWKEYLHMKTINHHINTIAQLHKINEGVMSHNGLSKILNIAGLQNLLIAEYIGQPAVNFFLQHGWTVIGTYFHVRSKSKVFLLESPSKKQ